MTGVGYPIIDNTGANRCVLKSPHMNIVIVFAINIIVDCTWVYFPGV